MEWATIQVKTYCLCSLVWIMVRAWMNIAELLMYMTMSRHSPDACNLYEHETRGLTIANWYTMAAMWLFYTSLFHAYCEVQLCCCEAKLFPRLVHAQYKRNGAIMQLSFGTCYARFSLGLRSHWVLTPDQTVTK